MSSFVDIIFHKGEAEAAASLNAISQSQAIIEFTPQGEILTANDNFLQVMGYSLDEIRGRHHSMFVDSELAGSPEYQEFWRQLAAGQFKAAEFKRIGKDGKEVWIQASYNPVMKAGKTIKVVKIASDVTAQKLASADAHSQLDAIGKMQAVIEFTLAGEILTANENFLAVTGYSLDEIIGRHHRMFVDPAYANSEEYASFWNSLGEGTPISAEFRRLAKGGREIWIKASYNPILDLNGRPYKVVKYATDATEATARKAAIRTLSDHLSRLAVGDLNARIGSSFDGDLDELRVAFNQSLEQVRSVVSQVRQASASLKVATGEILSGANDLADRTTQQAAAVEQTSAALEQLSTTVVDNAGRAVIASKKADSVRTAAAATGTAMHDASQAMGQISKSSANISNIIGIIDDIAFQTNLLALNASVEAARAGDAGKGFAVVAIEVRRLAQSAAAASADVKGLIEQSSLEVQAGSRKVSEAASSMSDMMHGIEENGSLLKEIAKVSEDQSHALGEITAAVRQIDDMTQHNAALVQQTNAAIEQTESQAADLDRLADFFTMESGPTLEVVTTSRVSSPMVPLSSPQRKAGPAAHPRRVRAASAV